MHETRANWTLSVWVGEMEDLKGLTLTGVPHIKDFECNDANQGKKKSRCRGTLEVGCVVLILKES